MKNRTLGFTFLEMFYWMTYAAAFGFTSVYLLPLGFTNTQIGTVTAVGGLIGVLAQPVFAGMADDPHGPSLRRIMLCLSGAVLLAAAGLMAFGHTAAAIAAVGFGTCISLMQILASLLTGLGMDTINQGQTLNFGLARGLGSGAYAVFVYICGIITGRMGGSAVPVMLILMAAGFAVSLAMYPLRKNTGSAAQKKEKSDPVSFFRRYPRFGVMLIGWLLVYIDHAFLNNFTYQIAVAKGGTSEHMGAIMAIGALVELPTMFGFAYILKRVRCDRLVRLSTLFFVAKGFGTYIAANMGMLYAVQVLQMGGWALIAVAGVYYVNGIMTPSDTVKGQAYMQIALTMATVTGSLLGGVLLDNGGVPLMLITGAICTAVGAVIVWAGTQREK